MTETLNTQTPKPPNWTRPLHPEFYCLGPGPANRCSTGAIIGRQPVCLKGWV